MATKGIEMKEIVVRQMTVTINGTSDLYLNKMDDVTTRTLTDQRKDKAKSNEKPNEWEKIITAMHWINGKPSEFTEESLKKNLDPAVNAPCISAFGLKKSWMSAVVQNKIDTYSTSFDATVNIIASNNLIPIRFAKHHIDEKLMSPKRGAPVLSRLNRFTGWSADVTVEFMETGYSYEQIINIVKLAGFGKGIGSGRSSGYGRYEIVNATLFDKEGR